MRKDGTKIAVLSDLLVYVPKLFIIVRGAVFGCKEKASDVEMKKVRKLCV